MTKKVLLTASTASHILRFHRPYIEAFQKEGFAVTVACGAENSGTIRADKILSLPFVKKMTAPANFRAAALLRREIQEGGYSLICTHTALAAFFTCLAARGCGVPLVNTVHGYLFDDDTPFPKRNVLLGAEKLNRASTDLLLTMNDCDEALARRYRLARRCERIPGIGVPFPPDTQLTSEKGVSLRRSLGIPDDAFILLYGAEFSRRKNHRFLLDVLGRLPEKTVLLLPGEGEERANFQKEVKEARWEKRVFCPGNAEDMTPYFSAADAAISPSRSEGLPFFVMEAMHARLPVAASAVKGHTDLLKSGESGLLFAYDDISSCVDAVKALLSSESLRHTLGSRARIASEVYALPLVLPVVLEKFLSVLS